MSKFDIVLKSLAELKNVLEEKSITGVNKAGVSHANSLVDSGKVVKPTSWKAPSAEEENAYIEKNGIEAFGKWHLGVDSKVDPKTKGHYGYIFTSDFKNVDRKAITAIKQRAGGQHQNDVLEAATKLLEKIDK